MEKTSLYSLTKYNFQFAHLLINIPNVRSLKIWILISSGSCASFFLKVKLLCCDIKISLRATTLNLQHESVNQMIKLVQNYGHINCFLMTSKRPADQLDTRSIITTLINFLKSPNVFATRKLSLYYSDQTQPTKVLGSGPP